jgi:hypothetical protein
MEQTAHICDSSSCPEPGKYFVTALDVGKVFYMAGPYTTHAAALAQVNTALDIAHKHDGRAWFMSWGTVRVQDDSSMVGVLNKHNLI